MIDWAPKRLPEWVMDEDGRRVPFEPDRISQSLYAASETMGAGDAFLAREMTDGVLHFLALDETAETPTTKQIAELIIKVVRELGQPELARAYEHLYAERRRTVRTESAQDLTTWTHRCSTLTQPKPAFAAFREAFTSQAVFSRDLRAAIDEGFVLPRGLQTPDCLAAITLGNIPATVASFIHEFRSAPANTLILDSPELAWSEKTSPAWADWPDVIAELCEVLERNIILNVNCIETPPWAKQHGRGPLFGPAASDARDRPAESAERVVEVCERCGKASKWLHVNWHIRDRDLVPADRNRWEALLARAMQSSWLSIVLDRPPNAVLLAPGVDRSHTALLCEIGLNLPRLLALVDGQSEPFHQKLPSLARMAVRAGAQRRIYLRRMGDPNELFRGFLLDRARLLLFPIGLDAVVQKLLGQNMVQSRLALDLGRNIVTTLRQSAEAAGRAANLDVALDVPNEWDGMSAENWPGLAAAPFSGGWESHLRTWAALSGDLAGTTLALSGTAGSPRELAGLLETQLKKRSAIIRFVRPNPDAG